jgi:hypothetical protein
MMHHPFRHLLIGGLSITSVLGAINANNLVAVAAATAAIVTSLWGAWRSERRKDFDQAMYEAAVKALVRAKLEAFEAGKPDPYPDMPIPGFPLPQSEPS